MKPAQTYENGDEPSKESTANSNNSSTGHKSLHKRRFDSKHTILPEHLSVLSPRSDGDGKEVSPGPSSVKTPLDFLWIGTSDNSSKELESICDTMLKRLESKDDSLSKISATVATSTKETMESVVQLERMYTLMDQLLLLKQKKDKMKRRIRDVEFLKNIHAMRTQVELEVAKAEKEGHEINIQNEVMEAELAVKYAESQLTTIEGSSSTRSKRYSSRWRSSNSKFRNSLLGKQRSRSAGGDELESCVDALRIPPKSPRTISEKVDKKKVSNWTKVKAAFKWERAANGTGLSHELVGGAVLVGMVALASTSSPPHSAPPALEFRPAPRTPSTTPHSPCSSLEDLGVDTGRHRGNLRDENDNNFLQTPSLDDSSTSPSPSKMHKSPWDKMKDMIHTRKESVRKKRSCSKSPSDSLRRRRSVSDGCDSATEHITAEEYQDEIPPQNALRKQRSLELTPSSRPPAGKRHDSTAWARWNKVKKVFLTSASASVPSSPSRHSHFFNDFPDHPGDRSSEVTHRDADSEVRNEIQRDYAELQSKLNREFSDKREKLSAEVKPVATEEQLSADFRKKLQEWQKMKDATSGSSQRQPPPVPDRADLSDEFLKKWDEWKRLKETNSVPAWGEEAKPDEVLVQTSTGLFRFHGISRSFTRKLHEWEKARGIAPEASTYALLKQARGRSENRGEQHQCELTKSGNHLVRTQSDGSVAPSICSSTKIGSVHGSSLSMNDADQMQYCDDDILEGCPLDLMDSHDDYDGSGRGAVLVEVEDEEVETAAALYAANPIHAPYTPVYTYDQLEPARHLCETSSCAVGSTTLVQYDAFSTSRHCTNSLTQPSSSSDQIPLTLEDSRNQIKNSKSKSSLVSDKTLKHAESTKTISNRKEITDRSLSNGKKKTKSRVRLERELSKPSESDTEQDENLATIEIPKRRKKPKKATERPKTPHESDTDKEVFVLKVKKPNSRQGSPEVIVKTTRKIFSPVVRDGEGNPSAVISVDVDELERTPHQGSKSAPVTPISTVPPPNRPPLPTSPLSQRKPPSKETAPSIRIMIQRYNLKLNEDGHTSQGSSGASSPAWRSPTTERRRPVDMPQNIKIRNNPFIEREVKKSASSSHLNSAITKHTLKPTISDITSRSSTSPSRPKSPLEEKISNPLEKRSPESMSSSALPPCSSTTSGRSISPDSMIQNRLISRIRTESESSSIQSVTMMLPSERTRRVQLARERFLSASPYGSDSTAEDVNERQSRASIRSEPGTSEQNILERSASAGMINVERSTWERVSRHGNGDGSAVSVTSGRFSLSRLAAKLRKTRVPSPKPNSSSVISKLCRQSLLIQINPDENK